MLINHTITKVEALIDTQENPFWFHRIIEPITHLIVEKKIEVKNDPALKLNFNIFLTLLLYFYLQGIDTLRSLITHLKTNPDIHKINLIIVGLSTIHDAFYRYSAQVFQSIYSYVLQSLPVYQIEEFKELGRLVATDGSIFPMAINDFWAEFRTKAKALKLHLHFELNQMITTCFCVTHAKYDERKVLAKHIEQAVTYIADRGYLCFDFFFQIVEKQAFFIIRSRKNLNYQVKEYLPVQLIDTVKHLFFQVSDELVIFNADSYQQLYRRVSFRTCQARFVLITNRLDLTTYQIIRLYAFRWQIELFFRFFKRTLNGIHLINHSQNGVSIQFYMILIINLLLMNFKRQQMQLSLFEQNNNDNYSQITEINSVELFLKNLGDQIPNEFKLTKQEINAIRNSLFKTTQLAFDFL